MLITINHNGFHGYNSVSFQVPAGTQEGDVVHVSNRVAKRLNDAVCGCHDCTCGEAIADAHRDNNGDYWYTVEITEYMIGNYPQGS